MITRIIKQDGWVTLAEYDYIVPLSKGDHVEFMDDNGDIVEAEVDCVLLDIENHIYQILVS